MLRKNKKAHKKSQALFSDYILSFILFLVLLSISTYLFYLLNEKNSKEIKETELSKCILNLDKAFSYEGTPNNWTNTSFIFPAVSSSFSPYVLNSKKLKELSHISYPKLSQIYCSSLCDFYINITYASNSSPFFSYGKVVDNNAKEIRVNEKLRVLNGEAMMVKIYVWK